MVNELVAKIKAARRVYIVGNGGSYANAQHLANDLIACGRRAHVLDPATLTATANDHGYEFIFSKWLIAFGEPGDLLIALSGSGKSPNILNALEAAYVIGMCVHRVFGNELDLDMQSAEEYQLTVAHEVRKCLLSQTA